MTPIRRLRHGARLDLRATPLRVARPVFGRLVERL